MSFEQGARLGRYEVIGLVGSGGMGEVYRARDDRLGRDVALKVLPEDLSGDARYRARLEREARTISQLQHPHVCTLHDLDSQDGVDFLVMEYLEGETLADRLARGPVPYAELRRIGLQVADAIDAAHAQGLVHRDLKPGNVMLGASGATVLDFGLARGTSGSLEDGGARNELKTQAPTWTAAITAEGSLVGTLPYMAPEQLEGKPASPRTDIWALGCLLYEMATGTRPFDGGTQASLIGAIVRAEPEPPSRSGTVAPAGLDHIVARCLQKDPERRWRSARDVALELEATGVDEGKGIENAATAPARRPAVLASTVVVAALALAAWWSFGRTSSDQIPMEATANVASDDGLLPKPGIAGLKRLLVLPLDNHTEDPDLDRLAVGVAEHVITRHAAVFPVVPRDAAIDAAGSEACDAAADVGAEQVLSGSVNRLGAQLRVVVQLSTCPGRDVFWSEQMDYPATVDLDLQDRIANDVFARMSRIMRMPIDAEPAGPGNPDWHLNQRTPEDNVKARELLEAALQEGAPIWREVFFTHLQALASGWTRAEGDTLAEMERLTRECFAALPRGSYCHFMDGFTGWFQGDVERTLRGIRLYSEIADHPPVPLAQWGWALALCGRPEEGLAKIEEAMRQSPEDEFTYAFEVHLATAHFVAGRYAQASEAAQRSLDLDVRDIFNYQARAWELLAASEAQRNRLDSARRALEGARTAAPNLSLEWVAQAWPDADSRGRFLDGLRSAGLDH